MYHKPVMLRECLEGLNIKPDGVYVDVTFGGGGHSKAILEELGEGGHLFGFDQDEDAQANVPDDARFTLIPHNFRHLKRFLKLHGKRKVDGILADLGVSSHQLDVPERGFSYRFPADLDMRMNQQGDRTAADILNTYSAADLQHLLSQYGEVRNARTLAQALVNARNQHPFRSTDDLIAVAENTARGNRAKYLAQVFQALRIEVNEEMDTLREMLAQTLEVLSPGGRLVVMSYHSLEDRLVKNFLRYGNFDNEPQKDFYGKIHRPFKLITKKAVSATGEEIKENNRARSAKLRIGELA